MTLLWSSPPCPFRASFQTHPSARLAPAASGFRLAPVDVGPVPAFIDSASEPIPMDLDFSPVTMNTVTRSTPVDPSNTLDPTYPGSRLIPVDPSFRLTPVQWGSRPIYTNLNSMSAYAYRPRHQTGPGGPKSQGCSSTYWGTRSAVSRTPAASVHRYPRNILLRICTWADWWRTLLKPVCKV